MGKINIVQDKKINIATGHKRYVKTWKNKEVLWSELVKRLSRTTRTSETAAEYKAMSRDEQSNIKDVGGFVGGYLKDGKRKNVEFRSVLTLDADYADSELWEDYKLIYGKAAAVYSTHKHTASKYRLRLIIPLARNVSPEEYQAIGHKVAKDLGIDKFDDTTYSPQRLMYWPSTSADAPFLFDYIDSEFLDPDEVLATYYDWRDISAWPVSSRVAELVHKGGKEQQDPLEKKGIVGAFCRAYMIDEAIDEFVPEYVACDIEGRYTYSEGSTSAGVITYDGKYSYSHHATDPSSGQLCNAWDLVRLHKFGDLDEGKVSEEVVSKRPSYKAMSKLASEDKKVKAQLIKDRQAEAAEDFSGDIEDAEWTDELKFTEKGGVAQTINNIVIILEHDEALKGSIGYNEMSRALVILKKLPWNSEGGAWTDSDDAALRLYLEKTYSISSKDKIFDAVNVVAKRHSFHPVRDYLDTCKWDGIKRLDTLLIDYLGAEDTRYTRAVTRKTLTAAVTRIYRPGCKFDYMLTLRGDQGIGKSTLIAKLGKDWYSDTFNTMQGKDSYEQLQGVWLMEVGELAGMRKAEAETIKLFISKQSDRFRPAYGRRSIDFPRQCIFVGTTNETGFLRDTTGNRRFWIVDTPNAPTKDLWADMTDEMIALIWAEAKEYYLRGEELFLDKETEAEARTVQSRYEEENPKKGIIIDFLDRLLPEDWDSMDIYERRDWLETDAVGTVERTKVCTLEIWAEALGGNPDKCDRYATKEIRSILDSLPDWKRKDPLNIRTKLYGKQRYYERIDEL